VITVASPRQRADRRGNGNAELQECIAVIAGRASGIGKAWSFELAGKDVI
jgi:hypothetical protein